jgi:hypothetical protein
MTLNLRLSALIDSDDSWTSMEESASRASMHGWRLLETLEAVSAEKKHPCYGECFA